MTYRLIASCLLAGIVAWHVEVPSVSLKFRDFFAKLLVIQHAEHTAFAPCVRGRLHLFIYFFSLIEKKIIIEYHNHCGSRVQAAATNRGFCKLNQPSSNTCLEARSQSIAAADVVIDAQTWWHCLTSFIFHPVVFRSCRPW